MSMFVNVVRVTPATFELIKKDPQQLEAVFFEGDNAIVKKLGIAEADSAGFDYISADMMLDAMGGFADDEDDDDEDVDNTDDDDDDEEEDDNDAVFKDLGADGTLAYEAGYGNAFTLSPAAVKKAAKSSSVIHLDDEVKALFEAAAQRGDYIIGVVT